MFLVIAPVLAQSPHGDELVIDCAKCHNPKGWSIDFKTIEFSHDVDDFQLEGTHTQIDCKSCHSTLIFNEAPTECISCHADVHSMSVGNDCVRCHTAETWLVDHIPELHEENGFPLMGAHAISSCFECHQFEADLIFNRIGNECINCHRLDYESTQNPNHESAEFSTNCIDCHSPMAFDWGTEAINHGFFPLTAGHDIQDCYECHTSGTFSDASPECVSCHQEDYAITQNPNHQTTGFSTDCVSCHTTNPGWTPAVINHDFFPLTLGHDIQNCKECHITDNYADVSPECVSCHQEDYASTQNPNHQTTGFSTDCISCHTTDPGWTPAVINHDFFPLALGHDIQDCKECHISDNYADASPECVSCHQDDYAITQNPNHQTSGFSTDCISCHTMDPGWTPAVINHDFFPLTLGHDIQDCAQCHTTGNYTDASPECVSCHQADYVGTQNPNHQTNGFSTDCVSCHTTNPAWTPAIINHDFFPLTLGHDIQDCAQCHTTGNYADASPECVSCHQNDYNQTTDPNHLAAQFPTDCVSCHTTNPGWTPAEFDHDGQYFRIYSGTHAGQWNDCATCHINPSNYTEFSCFECHTNPQTDEDHSEVTDYIYNSNACLQCHPT